MNALVLIAIANAILWTGVITGLLIVLMRGAAEAYTEVDSLEAKLDAPDYDAPA